MPKEVDDCVQSVLEDNPSYSESRAYAICNAMQNKGQLSMSDDASHDELLKAYAESDIDCPEGQVQAGDKCVPIEEVEDVPPGALDMSKPRVLEMRTLMDPIKRVEQDDGSVRYKNMALLAKGVWTDAGSGQPTLYDPKELEIVEDNAVNIAHDADNEVSEVGFIDADSWTVEGEKGYADVVLTMDSPASEYADENLKTALESGGQKGFGGPSIEIPAGAYELERNTGEGYPKLVNGEIHGAGLVMDPASKTTSFAHQVSQQGVAMSDGQSPMVYTLKDDSMEPDEIREKLNLSEDIEDETIIKLAEAGALALEEGEDEDEDEDTEMEEDEESEEEDDEETEMEDGEMIDERIDELWSEIEDLKEAMMSESELSSELEDAKQDLANAESVEQLQEAKDELDKRLSKLEDEPKEPKTLAEGDGDDDGFDWSNVDEGPSHDPATGSTHF